ncbi:MAG: MBL fold metallo-hydrolase [Epulopiscium sp. Nuni2H_MBin001]|nr:MAG: MBL fold metallo-hydrolase [Epulopiscium sp. Nuni2H_MBin001]
MKLKLCTLASSSSGNCTYINFEDTHILVDIGISKKRTIEALNQIDVKPESIQAIFVTHEHCDHVKGIGVFNRKYNTPIYATKKTWEVIDKNNLIGKVSNKRILQQTTKIKNLTIQSYKVSHDAVDPVGYIFEAEKKRIALFTDIGIIDTNILTAVKNCNGIMLEFNHDPNMVEVGNYPYYLKRRILGEKGHLSNDTAAKILADIYHQDLKWAMLAHLSGENNLPDLAYITTKNALEEKGLTIGKHIQIYVAEKYINSPLLSV